MALGLEPSPCVSWADVSATVKPRLPKASIIKVSWQQKLPQTWRCRLPLGCLPGLACFRPHQSHSKASQGRPCASFWRVQGSCWHSHLPLPSWHRPAQRWPVGFKSRRIHNLHFWWGLLLHFFFYENMPASWTYSHSQTFPVFFYFGNNLGSRERAAKPLVNTKDVV